MEFHFLVEIAKIENVVFQYITTLSKASVKTNRMGSINWDYHKEWNFASNCYIYFENFVSV